jgi:hypothetical protein
MVRFLTGDIGYLKDTHEKVTVNLYSLDDIETKTLSKVSISFGNGGATIVDQDDLFTQKEYRNYKIDELLNNN